MNNLELMSTTLTNRSQSQFTLMKERNVRKREVLLARISVYIVMLMVVCHSVRIIPTVWEIVQTFNMDTKTAVRVRQETDLIIYIIFLDFNWPPWVDLVTTFSHLAITISCSLSFYIYYAKYGANRKVKKLKIPRIQ